jgi:hypothetical protein
LAATFLSLVLLTGVAQAADPAPAAAVPAGQPPAAAVPVQPAATPANPTAPAAGAPAPAAIAPAAPAATTPSAKPVPADCALTQPKTPPVGNTRIKVAIDDETPWRPAYGKVGFTLEGGDFSPTGADVAVCMRWRGVDGSDPWVLVSNLVYTGSDRGGEASFIATVPGDFTQSPHNLLQRIIGGPEHAEWSTAFNLVPLADFRVIASTRDGSGWSHLDVTQPVGVTNEFFAGLVSFSIMVVAWIGLYLVGKARAVPGSGDWVLQVISTRSGYASLSQLQMILWTFVIGGSAAYVMLLTGSLIQISSGTLALLGISGGAALLAKLQYQTNTTLPAKTPDPPKPVPEVYAGPVSESEVRLAWAPPASGPPDAYRVSYRQTRTKNAQWILASARVGQPALRITTLLPGATYDFQVRASNSGGDSLPKTTLAKTLPARTGIGPVQNFGPAADVGNISMGVTWQALAKAQTYRVQVRAHDSDDDWSHGKITIKGLSATIKGLSAHTEYDFRISASDKADANAQDADFGPWAYLTAATGGPRVPRWYDLVIGSDGRDEIDITRVQMLFFTFIVAIFVALRVVATGTIPEIPESFLILMGISNGVYLSSKFIPS